MKLPLGNVTHEKSFNVNAEHAVWVIFIQYTGT